MLKIENVYKEKENIILKDIDILVEKGCSTSIECSNEISDLLFDLILGKKRVGKGQIFINDVKNSEYIKENITTIGVVFRDDALYEEMTIDSYIQFFSNLLGNRVDYKKVLMKLDLWDIASAEIKKLTYSQKRRVSFARELLKNPRLLIVQEPILNMDMDGASLVIKTINDLCSGGTAVLTTSVLFKDTMMIGDKAFRFDSDGLALPIDTQKQEREFSQEINKTVSEALLEGASTTTSIYTIEKIPAKLADKILLFDPIEIDYIESNQGVSTLYIRGEAFPCTTSLSDLEERLKFFGFFRCHRSYLVNLQRVREIITWSRNSYSLRLDDKMQSTVPLSKGRLDDLKSILKL